MNYLTFRSLVVDELVQQRSSNYHFWRAIPSAATRRTLAILDSRTPATDGIECLHDDVVSELCEVAISNDRRELPKEQINLSKWLKLTHQPWRFGAECGEWALKGLSEQRDLAAEILRLREASSVAPNARTLLEYYTNVSNEELQAAMQWKPIRTRALVDLLLPKLTRWNASLTRGQTGEYLVLVESSRAQLKIELVVRKGVFSYAVLDFFDNPLARASYEGLLGIGIGEWDRLKRSEMDAAAHTLAQIVTLFLSWKDEVS